MEFDWKQLEDLRAAYLDGTAGRSNYWTSDALLAAYDATFGQRIAWKWQWVLAEASRRQWTPPADVAVVDWGCGTGVAAREFLTHFGTAGVTGVHSHDRSGKAVRFATATLRQEFPDVTILRDMPEGPFILLVSHVLSELTDDATAALVAMARRAAAVVWVEPGSKADATRIVAVREKLREGLYPIAPCLHAEACGLLSLGHDRDWCHFFVPAPNEVFTDSNWGHFGREMGIDLRSLPVSFLVMDARAPEPASAGMVRVVGNARVFKGFALLAGCDACGVKERRFSKRTDGARFRDISKRRTGTLQQWTLDGNEITEVTEPS